jgi:hypothetical protein
MEKNSLHHSHPSNYVPQEPPAPQSTTVWYNEIDLTSSTGAMLPVWNVEPNSMIVSPTPNEKVAGSDVKDSRVGVVK